MEQNSLTSQLSHINRNHANVIKLSQAYLDAITSSKSSVSVELENIDGSMSTVKIPSNIFLSNELSRVTNTLKNLIGLSDTQSAIVSNDGSLREIFLSSNRTSFNQLLDTDIEGSTSIKLSTNDIVEQLISPRTEIEYKLPAEYSRSFRTKITKIVVKDGDFSLLDEGSTYSDVITFLSQNGYTYDVLEYDVANASKTSRYFGSFDVSEAEVTTDNKVKIVIDKLTYSDSLNAVLDSREIEVDDYLVNADGSLKLQVTEIDTTSNTIVCSFVQGVGSVSTGDRQLSIMSNDVVRAYVRIPVRMLEKSIIFLSPIEPVSGVAAPKSLSKLFDSTEFVVNTGGETYQFNEFFSSRVSDIGQYFESIVKESLIPASLGEKPSKPELSANDFNVMQVNTHLTNTPSVQKLQKLQKEKNTVQSQIDALNGSISTLNTKIAKGNYSTDAKKESDIALRQNKINDKLEKTSLLSSIVADITASLNNNAEQSVSPKYRVRGFWPVQSDIISDLTDPQKIVQYQCRYRYVSNTGNTANSPQVSYNDGDDTLSATFSPWTLVKTEPLERTIDDDGAVKWSVNTPSNADQLNINQLDIPIQYGESVEIQVRALSEAGWPTSPVTSDWSTLTRVDFPEELLQESDLAAIQRKNTQDQIQVKIQQEFATQGVTRHISEAIQEQDKYYAHDARQISSGTVTSEQNIVSQFEYNQQLLTKLKSLEEIVNRRYASIAVQLLDESLQTYEVNHFSTINLFAGYYNDEVDLTESANWGTIVEKTFHVRLINRNAQTVEMLSISPGSLIQNTGSVQYNNVPLMITGSNEVWPQKNGQIFYNRNTDINATNQLYVDNATASTNTILSDDIDNGAEESLKNVVHIDNDLYEVVHLISGASLDGYAVMHKSHPAYQSYVETNDDTQLSEEFIRIQQFNAIHRSTGQQNALYEGSITSFDKTYDKYLVGKNTVGATLYSDINNIDAFQVNGIDTGSAKEIYAGEQDSIMIPIKFQYRMTDALGNPNGDTSLSQNSNFTYSKTLGVDLLINGKKFTFDIKVSAKFRSTSASTNHLGIQSIGTINSNSNASLD